MSTLLKLKEKIESIPGKRNKRNLVGRLIQFRNSSEEIAGTLEANLESLKLVTTIFPKVNQTTVTNNFNQIAKTAESLQSTLRSSPEKIESEQFSNKFNILREKKEATRRYTLEHWKQSLDTKIDSYGGLIKAASDAGLPDASKLHVTVERLRTESSTPPINGDAAAQISNEIIWLEGAIASLNLKGKGGRFLVEAAAGNGNPKDLLDTEVVEFIEKYKLWGSLKVRLG